MDVFNGTVTLPGVGVTVPKWAAVALGAAVLIAVMMYAWRRSSGASGGSSAAVGYEPLYPTIPPMPGVGTGAIGGGGGGSSGLPPSAAVPGLPLNPPAASPVTPPVLGVPPVFKPPDMPATVGGGSPTNLTERPVINPAGSRYYVKTVGGESQIVDTVSGRGYAFFGAPVSILAAVGITDPRALAYYGAVPTPSPSVTSGASGGSASPASGGGGGGGGFPNLGNGIHSILSSAAAVHEYAEP